MFFSSPFALPLEREFNPDIHCGVIDVTSRKPCTRSLTCKVTKSLLCMLQLSCINAFFFNFFFKENWAGNAQQFFLLSAMRIKAHLLDSQDDLTCSWHTCGGSKLQTSGWAFPTAATGWQLRAGVSRTHAVSSDGLPQRGAQRNWGACNDELYCEI